MGIEVPDRAKMLRIIWSELHRMHSHLLWLGLFADAFGFESLFMQFWKVRERIMDINEATAGSPRHRVREHHRRCPCRPCLPSKFAGFCPNLILLRKRSRTCRTPS